VAQNVVARIKEDMMRAPSGPGNPPSKLSEKLNHRLNVYTLAASAAGVSLLALAQPSEAKIVYTKVHHCIGTHGVYNLDLNHDGVVDFLLQEVGESVKTCTSCGTSNWLLAKEALGNAVEGKISSNNGFMSKRYYASALKLGARIGPKQGFIKGGPNGEMMVYFREDQDFQIPYTYGQWIDVANRYLGLKFKIHGKILYGWARLSVQNSHGRITAELTGYAYETVPNQPIRAGQTESDSAMAPANSRTTSPIPDALRPVALGVLALGAQGVPLRRRP
jgi:hypothetical protein